MAKVQIFLRAEECIRSLSSKNLKGFKNEYVQDIGENKIARGKETLPPTNTYLPFQIEAREILTRKLLN